MQDESKTLTYSSVLLDTYTIYICMYMYACIRDKLITQGYVLRAFTMGEGSKFFL